MEITSLEAIERKYEEKLWKILNVGELISELEKEMEANGRAVLNQFVDVANYKDQLDESWTALQLINIRMNQEKKEKSAGYLERIKTLKRIRLLRVIDSFVSN